jgi:hypothetical protein
LTGATAVGGSVLRVDASDSHLCPGRHDGLTVNRWVTTAMLAASASSNEVGYLTHQATDGEKPISARLEPAREAPVTAKNRRRLISTMGIPVGTRQALAAPEMRCTNLTESL